MLIANPFLTLNSETTNGLFFFFTQRIKLFFKIQMDIAITMRDKISPKNHSLICELVFSIQVLETKMWTEL